VVLAFFGVAAVVVLLGLVVRNPVTGSDGDTSRPGPYDTRDAHEPEDAPALEDSPGQSRVEDDAPVDVDSGTDLPSLPDTDDPDVYATGIAEVLFGMDHANNRPADYEAFFADALWDEIDPNDQARIMATISRRIPTADMWGQMRSVEQAGEFEVELVWEPRSARNHRARGNWPDGWEMRTVSGTQTETWHVPGEQAQSSTRPVAVTVAMACPPAASPCRLIGILPHVES
jgi:hypothetical protein